MARPSVAGEKEYGSDYQSLPYFISMWRIRVPAAIKTRAVRRERKRETRGLA
jgi:hypothetical protein